MAKQLANDLRKERKLKEEKKSSNNKSPPLLLEQHTPEKQNFSAFGIDNEQKNDEEEHSLINTLRSLEFDPFTFHDKLEQEYKDEELAKKLQLLETKEDLTQEEIDKKLAMEAQDEGNNV